MVRGSGSPISTFMCSSLSEPLTRSAEQHLPDAQIHLEEIVDGDLAASSVLRRPAGAGVLAEQHRLLAP